GDQVGHPAGDVPGDLVRTGVEVLTRFRVLTRVFVPRLPHLPQVDPQFSGLDAEREFSPVSIHNGPSFSGDVDDGRTLPFGPFGQRGGLEGLDVHEFQPRGHQHECQYDAPYDESVAIVAYRGGRTLPTSPDRIRAMRHVTGSGSRHTALPRHRRPPSPRRSGHLSSPSVSPSLPSALSSASVFSGGGAGAVAFTGSPTTVMEPSSPTTNRAGLPPGTMPSDLARSANDDGDCSCPTSRRSCSACSASWAFCSRSRSSRYE